MRSDKSEELRLAFIRFDMMPILLMVLGVWIMKIATTGYEISATLEGLAAALLIYLIIGLMINARRFRRLRA